MTQTSTTAAMRPRITVIDPRKQETAKLRVAAYAMVSRDSADQLNSYMAQVDFYTKFISSREGWDLVDIYTDEKYISDALLQKTYMADLFTHDQRKNMGELPQYYVHECHPAIIDRDTFQRVQEELARCSSLRKTSLMAKKTELERAGHTALPPAS